MNFSIFLENYSKTVWTAITNSSHYVNATDFKTGQMLTEKPCKQNKNYKKLLPLQMYCIIYFLLVDMGMISLKTDFEDINITFFTEVWCFCLFIFACTISFISTCNTTFTNWVITWCKMFSRQPDRWYQVKSGPCDRSVLMKICFVAKTVRTNSWTSIVICLWKEWCGQI